MTTTLFPVLAGIVQASAFALLVRTAGARLAIRLHALLLLVAPLLYVLFAVRHAAWDGLLLELAGTAVFGGLALAGLLRRSTALIALGWALHPLWDVALHTTGMGAAYTPESYVAVCLGFDLALAVVIARGWAGLPTALRPRLA